MSHSCKNNGCLTPCEENQPDVEEMQCPIAGFLACVLEMDRNELASHISHYHPDYQEDPEPYFEAERSKRFGRYK